MDTQYAQDPALDNPKVNRILAKIVAQAWLDPDFRQSLLKQPKPNFVKAGIPLPADVDLTVVEDTPTYRNIILADKRLPARNQVLALSPTPDFYSVYSYVYTRVQQDPEFKKQF